MVKIYFSSIQLLIECGVVPSYDMTTEAAFTKLSYVLTRTELKYAEKVEVTLRLCILNTFIYV